MGRRRKKLPAKVVYQDAKFIIGNENPTAQTLDGKIQLLETAGFSNNEIGEAVGVAYQKRPKKRSKSMFIADNIKSI